MVVCFIRYEIDPSKREAFETYAREWAAIIPRLGGALIGYFAPHEGTNYVAFALVGFESLAAYEVYRGRLRTDSAALKNFAYATGERVILKEERTFLKAIEGTSPHLQGFSSR